MRRAERTRRDKSAVLRQYAGDRMEPRDLDRLVEGQRRKDRRQALREHRLARAGRSDHQHVMPSGGGDLKRPFRLLLPFHLRKIGERRVDVAAEIGRVKARRRDRRFALHMADERGEVRHGVDSDVAADARRLRRVLSRDVKLGKALVAGADRHRQHAAHALHLAGERKLAEIHPAAIVGIVRYRAARLPQRGDHREIERRAFLAAVGGREVIYDTVLGEIESDRLRGGKDALFRFAHGVVGQTDDLEAVHFLAERTLDGDGEAVDAEERGGICAGEHKRHSFRCAADGGAALVRRRREATRVVAARRRGDVAARRRGLSP